MIPTHNSLFHECHKGILSTRRKTRAKFFHAFLHCLKYGMEASKEIYQKTDMFMELGDIYLEGKFS